MSLYHTQLLWMPRLSHYTLSGEAETIIQQQRYLNSRMPPTQGKLHKISNYKRQYSVPLLHVSQCVSMVEVDNSCLCSHFDAAGLWAAIERCLPLLSKQLLMQVVLQHSRSILVILSHTLTVTGKLPNPHVWWVTEGTGSPNKRGDLSFLNPQNLWSGRNIGGNVKSFILTPCSGKHFGFDLTDGFWMSAMCVVSWQGRACFVWEPSVRSMTARWAAAILQAWVNSPRDRKSVV